MDALERDSAYDINRGYADVNETSSVRFRRFMARHRRGLRGRRISRPNRQVSIYEARERARHRQVERVRGRNSPTLGGSAGGAEPARFQPRLRGRCRPANDGQFLRRGGAQGIRDRFEDAGKATQQPMADFWRGERPRHQRGLRVRWQSRVGAFGSGLRARTKLLEYETADFWS